MPLPRSMSSLIQCSAWEKMGNDPVESWKKQIRWYSENDYFSELNRIDGQTYGIRVEDFPRIQYSGNPQ